MIQPLFKAGEARHAAVELGGRPKAPSFPESPESFRELLEKAVKHWETLNHSLDRQQKTVPGNLGALVELQRGMQNLGLQVNLATAVADAVNQTLKRLQQSAAS